MGYDNDEKGFNGQKIWYYFSNKSRINNNNNNDLIWMQ